MESSIWVLSPRMDTSTTCHSGGSGNRRKRTGGGAEKSPREGPGRLQNEEGRQAGS